MVLLWLFVIGINLLCLTGYFGAKYGPISGFEQSRFEKWLEGYCGRFPDAIDEAAEEWGKNHPGETRMGQWLDDVYLKEIKLGKTAIPIFGASGGILTAISTIF